MHYYQFNIGDYASHTRHLSLMEDLIYRRLLDWYYLNEKPIPLDSIQVARLIQAKDYYSDVETILNEFFTKTEDGWINKRADKEISTYQGFIEAGKRGAAKRWSKGGDSHPIAPPIANNKHKPLNTNQLKDMSPPTASTSKKGTRLPENWALPKAWGDWALSTKPELTSADVRLMAETFKDHWLANANRAIGKKADWLATWRNWVRNQKGGNYEANRRSGKTSITEKRHSIGEFIEREANAAAARLSEGAFSEDEGDIPAKVGLTVFK